jgi:hypothetical protein
MVINLLFPVHCQMARYFLEIQQVARVRTFSLKPQSRQRTALGAWKCRPRPNASEWGSIWVPVGRDFPRFSWVGMHSRGTERREAPRVSTCQGEILRILGLKCTNREIVSLSNVWVWAVMCTICAWARKLFIGHSMRLSCDKKHRLGH